MRTIWKFELKLAPTEAIEIPAPGEILAIEASPTDPYLLHLWAVVDPEGERAIRRFEVYETGWDLPDEIGKSNHVGTCLARATLPNIPKEQPLVWHVFEVQS